MEKVEEAADAQISNGGPDGTASLVEVERADRVEQKERVPALERNATVLFNIAWTESESGKQTVTFERQASRTDHPVTLSWSGLHVVAPGAGPTLVQRLKGNLNGKPDKLILNDVNGVAQPGQLIAIIGASGAGKTTFLNVLSRQNTANLKVSGSVCVNKMDIRNKIKDISAYVQQEDIFVGTLTVKEHLIFQALLRMSKSWSRSDKLKRVELVLEEMGLKKCANTVIGIPGKLKGISGGEKKRLSFASEILTNPPLLFADEPTSGLDSFMAETVVRVLQTMAANGKTVLCTIHQPSSEIFEMFGSVLLLAEGRVAYLGSREPAKAYFASHGYVCPENYNPADFYVHTLAIVPGNETECRQKVKELCDLFQSNTDTNAQSVTDTVEEYYDQQNDEVGYEIKSGSGYRGSIWSQFLLLLWRSWITQTRDPTLVRVKFGQAIFMAVLMGLIYLQVPHDEHRLQNISGVLFFVCVNGSLVNLFAVLQTFPIEMPVFLREHGSRLYRTEIYYVTKHLSDIPFLVILTFIYSVIIYWMVGLREEADKFFIFYGLLLLIANIAMGVGYAISAAATTVPVALAFGPVTIIPMMLFGGLFVNISSIPVYFYWISYLSWFYYGFEVLSINEWADITTTGCPSNVIGCAPNGTEALKFFGLKEGNYNRDIGILFALFIASRIAGLLILKLRVYYHEKRR
ncbi:protein white-like [Corticium candelabrum]|uniref:protein white-like n=1 Tax=Corticium candelabrum TaxID=121492 RepID=UPI002E277091|nr:protein white-like [Corticium candelabrum]